MSTPPQEPEELITSVVGRLWKLGTVTSKVGLSLVGDAVSGIFRTLEGKEARRATTLVENAIHVQQVLGRLKGAPMKIGQMLSLHEGILPEEVASVFRALQDQAPPVAMGKISSVLKRELGDRFQEIEKLDPEPCAAASIGQIHRARLHDGREVVFKVQYPGIDKTITSDMKSLKGALKLLLSWFTHADTEALWREIRDRMLEEIDYEHEAESLRRIQKLWADEARIHIPVVVDGLSTRRVLCMESLDGWTGDGACDEAIPQSMRDEWGRLLFRWVVEGVFEHRLLHADPNLANFSFRDDGGINVYDFGCVKEVTDELAQGYARLARSMLASRYDQMPGQLRRMGIDMSDGRPIDAELAAECAKELRVVFRRRPPYRFGEDQELYERSYQMGMDHWQEGTDMRFPADIMFIHRTFAGLYGNLCKLNAVGPWREILEKATAGS